MNSKILELLDLISPLLPDDIMEVNIDNTGYTLKGIDKKTKLSIILLESKPEQITIAYLIGFLNGLEYLTINGDCLL